MRRRKKTTVISISIIFMLLLMTFLIIFFRHNSPRLLKGYNLIIICIDALRADHLGCYGYHRDTSPFIDRVAEQGILFEQAMSNSSYTRESVSALFSGQLPSHSEAYGWFAAPSDETCNLGEIFQRKGYVTGLFSNSVQLKNPAFNKGFDQYGHLPEKWEMSRAGPKLSARALEFVRINYDRKFMMYLHYLDPHGPYDPPPHLYERFAGAPMKNRLGLYSHVRGNCLALRKKGFGPGEPRFEDMVSRYDAEIADSDHSVETLFVGLKQLGLLENTLIIITADHGEEFLEHDYVEHAWTVYQESLRVPLIFWAPGYFQDNHISRRVSLVDVLPTVLKLMDIKYSEAEFDGTALFIPDKNGCRFKAPTSPQIAELLIQPRNLVRTVIEGDWKYIAAQKWLTLSEREESTRTRQRFFAELNEGKRKRIPLWAPIVHEELYNLSEDPGEKNNLISSNPAIRDRLNNTLRSFKEQCQQFSSQEQSDPSAPLSEKERERLRSLGYIH